MPSDAKKKKAQAKKDARRKPQNRSQNAQANNDTASCSSSTIAEQKLNGDINGNDVTTIPKEVRDNDFEGSEDENEEMTRKLTQELDTLDLLSERVSHHRAVTGVLASHPEARDVRLQNVSITFHGQEILQDSSLEFINGRRYGLLGLNGCGKSTLLACLATRELQLPDHLDVFLLQREMAPSDKTALESVTDVDQERQRLEDEAEKLATMQDDDDANDRLMTVYERLDELDSDLAESRAANLLFNLGFTPDMQRKQVKHFSGGWRMRIALARALFVRPSLLLLDEPTNHLDLNACVWLERELSNYPRCLIVISHSQDFLNGVCTNIIHMQRKSVKYFGGNYDQFMQTRMELEENQMKRYKWEQGQIAHMKDYIARFGHGSRKLARQAQSKEKVLAKMVDGGLTQKVARDKTLTFCFPDCGKLPPPIIQVQNVSFRYSAEKPWIYENLEFGVDLDRRIALVGPNGAGKSTLLKLIAAELEPTDGLIRRHSHVRIGRYHQHLHEMLDINMTALNWMMQAFPQVKEIEEMRKILGRYGLTGAQQVCPIKALSDGQRCRIIFGWLAMKTPHMLLLDEPTNHLDIETIDALADAINDFEGGLMLVSHDFRLISQVAEEIWVCENKTVTPWPDADIMTYKQHLVKQIDQAEKKKASILAK